MRGMGGSAGVAIVRGGGDENCPLILDKYVPLHVC